MGSRAKACVGDGSRILFFVARRRPRAVDLVERHDPRAPWISLRL
jgi:hypothetical protein